MAPHVIILGCGRSGTSIFGELFEAIPEYKYLFEPQLNDLKAFDFSAGPVAIKVPRDSSNLEIHTPGLPFNLTELFDTIPEPRVIFWMVRHPLDAIASLKPGISKNWSHNPKPVGWEMMTVLPLTIRCALHWQNINQIGYGSVSDLTKIVRYEDMIKDPLGTVAGVLGSIGLTENLSHPSVESWVDRVTNKAGVNEAKHQIKWSTKDHAKHVGRWRENLTVKEVVGVARIIAPTATKFGYSLPLWSKIAASMFGFKQ